jgi:hypothetical protein
MEFFKLMSPAPSLPVRLTALDITSGTTRPNTGNIKSGSRSSNNRPITSSKRTSSSLQSGRFALLFKYLY